MNIKHLLLPLALCSVAAVAAEPAAQRYVYGMPLDIHKVVAINEPAGVCGVVTAQLTYDDSHGVRHVLDYRKWSNGCGVFDDGGL